VTPSTWIALAALCLTVLGAAVYLGRLIGSLPGMIAAAVREHEDTCSNYERHTSPRMRAVGEPPQ
jgi:ABC-type branched-subunit amino acid transport system permease subunit